MSWFRRKAVPKLDQTEGHPLIKRGLRAFEERDWLTLRELYDAQSPSDACHFVMLLGELTDLDERMVELGGSPTALTLQAGIRDGWAGRHRGDGIGSTVTEDGAKGMILNAVDAYNQLIDAEKLRPNCSVIAALRVRALIYLKGDAEELEAARQQFQSASKPRCWFFGLNHLTFETPKWHGSMARMWKVAHAYAERPENAAWVALLARAYIEEWLYTVGMSDDKAAKKAYRDRRASPEYRDEIIALDTKFWDHYREGELSYSEAKYAHNNIAFLLWRMDLPDRLAPHLDKMGSTMTIAPWCYFVREGHEMKVLARLRKRAELAAL